METIEKNYSIETDHLIEQIEKFVDVAQSKSKKHDWKIEGDLDKFENLNWHSHLHLTNISRNRAKKVRNYLQKAIQHPTLKTINLTLHFLTTKVAKKDLRIKVAIGEKEQKIQAARKRWVEARDAAQIALLEYKNEKGDFYK